MARTSQIFIVLIYVSLLYYSPKAQQLPPPPPLPPQLPQPPVPTTLSVAAANSCCSSCSNYTNLASKTFPLSNCLDTKIDLLLAAYLVKDNFQHQMRFFALLVDLFLGSDDVNCHRLNVAMITYKTTSNNGTKFQEVFDYSKYSNKSKAKDIIMALSYDDIVNKSLEQSFPNFSEVSNSCKLDKCNVSFSNSTLNAILDAREDAQQVSVFVVEQSQLNLFLEADLKTWSGDSKLFYVIIDDPFYDSPVRLKPSNYARVKSYTLLEDTHEIPYGLCGTCYPGWFWLKQRHPESLVWTFSCYYFVSNLYRIAWSDSSRHCEEKHSTLVSIETIEEFNFLKPILYENFIQWDPREYDWGIYEFPIHIGLVRDSETLAKRFRWVNFAPLTITNWNGISSPDGGYAQPCGAWIFSHSLSSEIWNDFGCGYRNSFFYVCETDIREINPSYLSTSTVKESNSERIYSAMLRGETALCSGTLFSASVVLNKHDIRSCFLVSENKSLIDWTQPVPLFECENHEKLSIAYSFVCDHKIQCPNGRDEQSCRYRNCKPDEFTCSSKQCVPADARCDMYKDCFDGSDEMDCQDCRFNQCVDGTCLLTHWWTDDQTDCVTIARNIFEEPDEDAESPLENYNGRCAFMCNRTKCVTKDMMNNSIVDCMGPEGPLDETVGALESTRCLDDLPWLHSLSWAPKCVFYRDRYDSPLGCRNMNHLQGCKDFKCPDGYIKCPGSYCIPMHQAHDGKQDCPLGEDEMDEFFPDCKGNFLCMGNRVCVYVDLLCDGYPHCPEGDDELNCNISCSPGFRCVGGTVTVDNYDRSKPLMSLNFMDPRIRYIDLSGVILSEVFPNLPLDLSLANLNVLLLPDCGIKDLDNQYLNNRANLRQDWLELSGVHTMDLSHNNIEYISEQSIIKTMYNLRVLSLSHNNLKKIDVKAFQLVGLSSSIQSLDLSFTEITTTFNVLNPLVNLKNINLSSTPLADLKPKTFPSDGGIKLQVVDLRSIEISYVYPDTFNGLTVSTELYSDTYRLCCPQVLGAGIDADVCQAPVDPFSNCTDLMGDEFKRVLLWLIGFSAVFGNLVVIIYRTRWTRQVFEKVNVMFVIHLAVSDILMGIYLIIIASADIYYRNDYVWHDTQWRNSVLCKIAGFASLLSSEVSACFIFFITIDLFQVLKYPFSYVKLSKGTTFIICCLVWLVGFTIAVIPLFPKFKHWGTYSSNGMCLGLPLTSKRLPGWQFSSIVFIGFNSVLYFLIAIGQILIYRTMDDDKKQQFESFGISKTSPLQDFAMARQLFLVAISNFLCWFPIGIMGLVSLGGHDIGLAAFAWSTVLVMPINSALNPVMYTIPALRVKFSRVKKVPSSTSSQSTTQQVCSKCQTLYKVHTRTEESSTTK